MCGCDCHYVCPRCTGTPADPLYVDAEPREPQPERDEAHHRHVAISKQWQVLQAAKIGPCRICLDPANNGHVYGRIQLHHVVSREDHGDDYAANLVPLCPACHDLVTRRSPVECRMLLAHLTDAEYAYMIKRGGEQYPERAYGIRYGR